VRLDGPSILDDVPGYTAHGARPPHTSCNPAKGAEPDRGKPGGETLRRAEAA
jgi:hypothetical protein